MHKTRELGLIAVGLSLSSANVLASADWVCPHPNNSSSIPKPTLSPLQVQANAIHVEADQALFKRQGASQLQGDVIIANQDTQLRADQASFNPQTQDVSASGAVYLFSPGLELSSDRLNYNLQQGTGEIQNASYQLSAVDGRGSSKKLIRESKHITRLNEASFTTCPPGTNTWAIQAKSIELNQQNGQGTARNVSLQINGRSLLYLPYFSFPLSDQRKSGLLTPNFTTDEKSGLQISVPYYFNLAPNYDLTLTGNFLSKRGVQLDSQFRYLLAKHGGEVNFEFLPDDNETNRKNRYYFDWFHSSHTGSNSELTLNAQGVSDNAYFNDLGTSLDASSTVRLERSLKYRSNKGDWSFAALLQDYQVLDNSTNSYARLPQLRAEWRPKAQPNELVTYARTEYTFFSDSESIDGHRFDISAGLSRRFGNQFAYVTPAVEVRHTQYELDREANSSIQRSLPTASLDTGLFFERPLKEGKWIQTLEPRIFYSFTPFQDQDDIPVFDSSRRTFNYSQLFQTNRYTGSDRIEDANRLTTSITTRLQDTEKGREVLRASIGQMYHFDDRKVTLPDESIERGNRSELVLEASGELNEATRMTTTAFVDTGDKSVTASQVRIHYKDRKSRILNLGYSQRKNEYAAAHISFATPVTKQWKLAGGYEQDLENKRMLESVVGLEYHSCCWKGRIAARKYLLSDNSTYDDALFMEVELKGLGDFGSGARKFLGNRIYGYE